VKQEKGMEWREPCPQEHTIEKGKLKGRKDLNKGKSHSWRWGVARMVSSTWLVKTRGFSGNRP